MNFDRAIARRPSRSVVDGLSAAAGPKPSYDGIVREHAAYIAALNEAGLQVDLLDPLEPFPDSIFVEDTALVFTGAAISLRPGALTRSGEVAEMLPALRRRFDRVLELNEGRVDGGDVLTTPSTVFIGRSARTDAQGAAALTKLLAKLGISGITVRTPPGVLHLKSDCALIDEETILMTARLAASNPFPGFRTLIVPEGEEPAANALRLNDRILAGEAFPRTRERLARQAKVVTLPTTEIAKIDAGLSCMSLRWKA
jgi:dimethylargininase